MSDQLAAGAAWLSDRLQASASETITYTRGAQSATFAATLGSSLLKTQDAGGRLKIERTDRDFVFPTAALAAFTPPLPVRGDTIDVTVNGVAQRFAAWAPGNEPHYRHPDPTRLMLRVHGKYQGTPS